MPSPQAVKALNTAILKAINGQGQARSADLSFVFCGGGIELGIECNMLSRKVALLRRMLAKHPEARAEVDKAYFQHLAKGHQGTGKEPPVDYEKDDTKDDTQDVAIDATVCQAPPNHPI